MRSSRESAPAMRKFDNPLGPARRAGYPEATRRLKDAVRNLWTIEDGAAVTVAELACDHADCPGVETVIAVLRAGEAPRIVRVPKRLPDVTADDLASVRIDAKAQMQPGELESPNARQSVSL